MSTSTPRLQLTKALGSESMILGAAQLSDDYAKIDAAMGVKKFATTGAATNVFNGDLILETSTGKSQLFNSPNWVGVFDPNNGKGNGQVTGTGPDQTVDFLAESLLFQEIINVEAGRKYLAHFSISLTAVLGGGSPSTDTGYGLLNFYYGTNLAVPPSILIHDCASYIDATTSAKSKSLKAMFEFFPNITGQVKFGMKAETISGSESMRLNISGSTGNVYLTDWGV